MRFAAVCVLLPLLTGCVTIRYVQEGLDEPVQAGATDGLQPGETDLAHCVDRLGAPTLAWEARDDCVALAYAWRDESGWSVKVGWQFRTGVSPSYEYGSTALHGPGVVLLFDAAWRLQQIRHGDLGDIARELAKPKRPASTLDQG